MIIDPVEKAISIKIVYFGPALSGKTTSIKNLFAHFGKEEKILSIESTVNRTLFFDYGVISFQNQDWILKISVYTTTGQNFYLITRPITLKAVDGIIFVLDSQKDVYERNIISWRELVSYFGESLNNLPILVAFNKQDLPNKFTSTRFLKQIEYHQYNSIDSRYTIAISGEGVLECFEDILRLILTKYYDHKLISTIN
ncbi:MAG: ATP/GTP-binding protein [Candidatus Hermodarchaeota archaeon]